MELDDTTELEPIVVPQDVPRQIRHPAAVLADTELDGVEIVNVPSTRHFPPSSRVDGPSAVPPEVVAPAQENKGTPTNSEVLAHGEVMSAAETAEFDAAHTMHPFLLTFASSDVETRFVRFCYVTSSFVGGKLWFIAGYSISMFFYMYYHGIVQGWNSGMFTTPAWIPFAVNNAIAPLLLASLFVPQLARRRELLYLVGLVTHWPSFTIVSFFGMGSVWKYRFNFVVGCLFFCTFVAQARFSRVMPILLLSPLLTLIFATSFMDSYWSTPGREHGEIMLWLAVVAPTVVLVPFERIGRRAFCEMEKSIVTIEKISERVIQTEDIISCFFAKTPTLDFLSSGFADFRPRIYIDSVLIYSDLVQFTSWSSSRDAQVVTDHIARMFIAIGNVAAERNVEQMMTVGDAFVGCIFPSEKRAMSRRCADACLFATNILDTGAPLSMRVGVACGDVVVAFVGTRPPRFDIFGETATLAQALEQSADANFVQASTAVIDHATPFGVPTGVLERNRDERSVSFSAFVPTNGLHGLESEAEVQDIDGEDDLFTPQQIFNVSSALCSISATAAAAASSATANPLQRPFRGAPRGRRDTTHHNAAAQHVSIAQQPAGSQQVSSGAHPSTEEHQLAGRQHTSSVMFVAPAPEGSVSSFSHSQHEGGAVARRVATSATSASLLHQSPSLVLEEYRDMASTEEVALSKVWLTFMDETNEKLYVESIRATGLPTTAALIISGLNVWFICAFFVLGCVDTVQNRALLTAIVIIQLLLIVVLAKPEWRFRGFSVFLLGCLLVNNLLSHFFTATCSIGATKYTGAILTCLLQDTVLVSQFLLTNRLTVRMSVNVMLVGCGILGMTVRQVVTGGDDVLPWDPVWVLGIGGLAFVSFFSDFSLRTSFSYVRLLALIKERSANKYHDTTVAALNIMLPPFAIERLLRATGGSTADAIFSNAGSRTFGLIDDGAGDESADVDGGLIAGLTHEERRRRQAQKPRFLSWAYESIGVMFIKFEPATVLDIGGDEDDGALSGADANPLVADAVQVSRIARGSVSAQRGWSPKQHVEINAAFLEVEKLLADYGLHKIKSIGSTVLCASGIEVMGSPTTAQISQFAISLLDCASAVRGYFATQRPTWKFKIGAHLGPCIGAIIGRNGVFVDIFGDSVNVASRLCMTASNGTVQISDSLREGCRSAPAIHSRIRFHEKRDIKGKGTIEVFDFM